MAFAPAAAVAIALLVAAAGKAIEGRWRGPVVEVALAAWLLSGAAPVWAAVACGLFLVACVACLVPMAATDPTGDCGCFGPLAPASPLRALNRVVALGAATVAAAVLAADPMPAGVTLGAALVLLWRGGELLADRLRGAALSDARR